MCPYSLSLANTISMDQLCQHGPAILACPSSPCQLPCHPLTSIDITVLSPPTPLLSVRHPNGELDLNDHIQPPNCLFLANVPPYRCPPFRHVCFICNKYIYLCINNNVANNTLGCLHPMPLSEHFICNKIFSNYKIYLFINGVRQPAFANGSQHGCHTIFHHFYM